MRRSTVVTLLAFIAFVSLGLPDGLLGVSWPSIRESFDQPIDALGLIVALTTAGYLTSSFLAGAILKRLSIGMVLALSTAAAALALLGTGLAPVWPPVVLLAALAGLGGGAVDAGLNAYGARHFSARTLNWLHAFFGLGSTSGPLIVTTVLSAGLSWRWSYLFVGCAQLALAVVFLKMRQRWDRVPETEAPAEESPSAPVLQTLRRPVVWVGMVTFFIYGVEIVTAQWCYSLMTLGRGVGEATAGTAVALYWGSLMVGRVLFGLVAERVRLVPTLRFCILGSVAGAALFWANPVQWAAILGLMTIGFCFGPFFASLISLTPARVGAVHADSAIGFQIASAGLGGATLTGIVGLAADAFGLEIIGGAILLLCLALLCAFETVSRVGERPAIHAS